MSSTETPLPAAAPPYVGALLRLAHRKARAQALASLAAAGFADLQEAAALIATYSPPADLRGTALA